MSSPVTADPIAGCPRFAEAAVERARLTVVPAPAPASHAPRVPFATLVSVLLGGVVGLLMFNTQMQQASFTTPRCRSRPPPSPPRSSRSTMELDTARPAAPGDAPGVGMVPPARRRSSTWTGRVARRPRGGRDDPRPCG